MSLLGSMTQGKKRNITINVEDVRPNPMNMYHFEDEVIDSLANSIKKYGQLENATVYEDTSKNDGCKYTLIGGESRYRAISGLSMGGGGALFYALHYPEMFVAAAPLSAVGGAWTFDQMKSQSDLSKVSEEKKAEVLGQMDIQTILEKSPKEKLDRIKWIRWYISCGDDDFLSVTNCLLHNTLLQHQVGHEFRMKDGSHSWTYWRMELPEVMRFVSRIFTQY